MSATNKRITELTSASAIASDDYMAIDSVARGTKKYKVSEILDKIDDDFDTVVSEMQFSNPPDVYPYNKGDIVWRDDNGTKKIYVAKDDYPSGVTEYDSGEWDEYDTLAEVIKADVPVASEISYDNTTSGLTATDVQDAIDEVSGDIPTTLAELSDDDTHRTVTDTEKTTWSGKQDTLTFDNVPTEDSNNPVKSGGIFDEFADKQAQIDVNTMIGTVPNLPSSIASFSGASELPMPKLKVAIEPQQDLHGYDAPWVGGAGKNKFDVSDIFESKSLGGSDGQEQNSSYRNTSNYILINVNSNYVLSLVIGTPTQVGTIYICFYDTNKEFISSTYYSAQSGTITKSFTTPNNAVYVRFAYDKNSSNIQLESGSTATSYAPYSNICPISGWDEANVTVADDDTDPTVSNVYTIDLDGTRYGGKVDLVSGVMTVDRAIVDMGDMSWTYSSGSGGYFTGTINGCIIPTIYSNHKPICEAYNGITPNYINALNNGEVMYNTTYGAVFVKDLNYTGATEFKSAVSGIKLVYELATPLTIQLTPTAIKSLIDQNNLFADCGDVVEASYVRNATLTINDILARIEALENA